jgi:hypothetical protein
VQGVPVAVEGLLDAVGVDGGGALGRSGAHAVGEGAHAGNGGFGGCCPVLHGVGVLDGLGAERVDICGEAFLGLLGAVLGFAYGGVGGLAVPFEGLRSARHGAAVFVGEALLFAYVLGE